MYKSRKEAEPRFVRLTLEWCNRQRKKRGLKPLKRLSKGYQGNSNSCPCGVATGLRVYMKDYRSRDNKLLGYLPKSVTEFIKAFDAGKLPQYIKGYSGESK